MLNINTSNLVKFIARNYLILIPAISIFMAFFGLGMIAFQYTTAGRALYFEKLSQKFPPSSVDALRFRSIAHALTHGKKTYTFHVKGEPPIAQ